MSLRIRIGGPSLVLALTLAIPASGLAKEYKYSLDERIILTRDLTAEFATSKITIPRSKKPLPMEAETGVKDMIVWSESHRKFGPAAQMGDIVQVTKIKFESKRIVLQLNGGFRGGGFKNKLCP